MSAPVLPPARAIDQVLEARPTIEGAGVHLRRAFGNREVPRLDPFLLLDDFRSENPAEFMAGFPWHPHRGIETVTYMLGGKVEHGDSIGNEGIIGPGDVQWMTSGSGIIHQEMPKLDQVRKLGGFQLWVNLPSGQKMSDPRYLEVKDATIPWARPAKGVRAKVIAGTIGGVEGPVRDISVRPQYLDVRMEPRSEYLHSVPTDHTAFAYVVEGKGSFDPEGADPVPSEHLVLFKPGASIRIKSRDEALRFLLVSGQPLKEPVAWWGPIVMNTRQEIETAIDEYQNGTFVKVGKPRRPRAS